MIDLWIAVAAFVALHRVLPRNALRDPLVRRVGERSYLRAFGVASVAALVWLGVAYAGALGVISPATIRIQVVAAGRFTEAHEARCGDHANACLNFAFEPPRTEVIMSYTWRGSTSRMVDFRRHARATENAQHTRRPRR